MNPFNVRLKELRLLNKIHPQELANLAGITLKGYYLYEQGKTEPKLNTLIKFADAFNVSLDYLVAREYPLTPCEDEID